MGRITNEEKDVLHQWYLIRVRALLASDIDEGVIGDFESRLEESGLADSDRLNTALSFISERFNTAQEGER